MPREEVSLSLRLYLQPLLSIIKHALLSCSGSDANASTTPVGRLAIAAVLASIRGAGGQLLWGSTASVKVSVAEIKDGRDSEMSYMLLYIYGYEKVECLHWAQ